MSEKWLLWLIELQSFCAGLIYGKDKYDPERWETVLV